MYEEAGKRCAKLVVVSSGGRLTSHAAKGDVPTVPQLQAQKGSITMTGALSAIANQVTWLFSSSSITSFSPK